MSMKRVQTTVNYLVDRASSQEVVASHPNAGPSITYEPAVGPEVKASRATLWVIEDTTEF